MAMNVASNIAGGIKRASSLPIKVGNVTPQVKATAKTVNGSNASSGVGNYNAILQTQRDYNNAFNIAQTEALNAFNSAEAQKNRDWQERMARNAHQYEVQDLIAAGLNPVLSAGGQGAYVGSGAVAQGSKATADDTLSNGLISLMGAMIAASSASTVANIYTQNQRYMAENYPSNPIQFLNALFSNNDGTASGIKNAKNALSQSWSKFSK